MPLEGGSVSSAEEGFLMSVKLFLLGRPGSGKSMAARYMLKLASRKGLATGRINDYSILYQWFQVERHRSNVEHRYFQERERDGFDVIDFSVLRLALEEIQKRIIRNSSPGKLIFIEFARDNYSEVLQVFDRDFLRDAYFLFLDAPVPLCVERVYKRSLHPKTVDDHFVSKEIIEGYYGMDCRSYIETKLASEYLLDETKVRVIDNNGTV